MLFEYVVISKPKKHLDAQGNDATPKPEIVVPVSQVLADTEPEAAWTAARAIPDKWAKRLDELDIHVRPF